MNNGCNNNKKKKIALLRRIAGRTDGRTEGHKNGRTDGRTDGQTGVKQYALPLKRGHKKKNVNILLYFCLALGGVLARRKGRRRSHSESESENKSMAFEEVEGDCIGVAGGVGVFGRKNESIFVCFSVLCCRLIIARLTMRSCSYARFGIDVSRFKKLLT